MELIVGEERAAGCGLVEEGKTADTLVEFGQTEHWAVAIDGPVDVSEYAAESELEVVGEVVVACYRPETR